ncbi:MAG: serine O-acetyltransferase, partial [Planktomarina sp.]
MTQTNPNIAALDPIWDRMLREAADVVAEEPLMGGMLHAGVLHHKTLEAALSFRIAQKLASADMPEQMLRELVDEALALSNIGCDARADLAAVLDRDPATQRLIQPLMYFKGFQAVQSHRVAHWLWNNDRKHLAYFIQ